MRHNILYPTLVFLLMSGSFLNFNYSYSPHLAIVNEINTASATNFGKDNQLDHFTKLDYQLRTVVIDAGHGGHDHGCSGKHSKEKHIALNISKKLGRYIKGKFPKVKVIYTREKDVFIPLHTRAEIANKNKADLFISIHCNAMSTQKHLVRGTETYVMGLHNADENLVVAKRENEAILLEKDYEKNYHGFDPESPEGHIILAMVQNAFLEQSISFAEKVEYNFKNLAGRKSRGVKQAGFLVLRETTMPSVLIETGYLTHQSDEKYMKSKRGQDELAFAIFKAFQSYKREIEVDNATTPAALPAKRLNPINSQKVLPKEKNVRSSNSVKNSKKTFKVQLAASTKSMKTNTSKWKKVKFPIEMKRENGNFKYLAGDFETLAEANAARKKMRRLGFKGAFVVAYQAGKRVKTK
ncbi:MAG: N-acetylmuramoyl-L-alanine amidase [Saprospiraceae bacterium]